MTLAIATTQCELTLSTFVTELCIRQLQGNERCAHKATELCLLFVSTLSVMNWMVWGVDN